MTANIPMPGKEFLTQLKSSYHSCFQNTLVKSIEEFYEGTKWKWTFMEAIM